MEGLFSGISRLNHAESRVITAENFTGEKGAGGAAETGTGARGARDLGIGWKVSPSIVLQPGEKRVLADLSGPGIIQSMWFTGTMNRFLILRIYWEEMECPSVECPLTDFFGVGWMRSGAGWHDGPLMLLNSAMVAVNPNRGLNCFWEMPFRRRCRITLENRAECDQLCYYQIHYAKCEVDPACAYFHAQFRHTAPLRVGDCYTILDNVHGQGHYVGPALQIGLNGASGWWGEGEIKFYLDGDSNFPTICGTGTEDYVGGAFDWNVDGTYTTYSTPFMGMHYVELPDGLYRHQPRFSMYRWHIVDPIHFKQDLRITIQNIGVRPDGRYLQRRDDFASVAYWYQTLPFSPFPPLAPADELEVI